MKPLTKRLLFKIVFLLVISVQSVRAQDSCFNCKYDSLENKLYDQKTDAERIKLLTLLIDLAPEPSEKTVGYLVRLIQYNREVTLIDATPYEIMLEGFYSWRKGEFQQALNHIKKAVASFDSQKKRIVTLLGIMPVLFNRLNQQEERYKFYKEKLEYYLINGPIENTAPCYHGIAGYYTYRADYNLAISNYLKAAAVTKKFSTRFYNNEIGAVGHFYSVWGNDEKAIQYLKRAIPLHRALLDSSNLAFSLNALSRLALKNKNYEQALQYTDESIKVWNKGVSEPGYALLVLQKGLVYLEKKQPAIAYPYLAKVKGLSDSLYTQITSNQGELEIDFALYRYHFLLKDYRLAEQYLSKAYAKAINEKSNLLRLKYLKELSVFYERQHPELALKYIGQFFQLNDTIQQTQNRFKVAQYEYEEKELEQNQKLYALREERAVQEAAINKRNTVLWISCSALALICATLIFLYRQFRINKKTLLTLRKTQRQLIFSEKMASLGELTAGIAHEIQNPLNFVNNFSEVNKELLVEIKDEINKGNIDEVKAIANDLSENEEKINHHGKRADAIVKGMLQHSRSSTNSKEPTDLNALTNEYLRLAYHGLRAKDKSFNAELKTDFDNTIGNINIIPQDIGRVILNLINNAFYSVSEKKKQNENGYEPTVSVSTKKNNDKVEIKVSDNGNGIPQKVLAKIFQPFFTTKPTGQGTGLGLSLSYDIVKAHGGEIKVEAQEGEFAEFVISIPD